MAKPKTKPKAKRLAKRKVRAKRKVMTGSSAAKALEHQYLAKRRVEDLAQAYVSLVSELWIIKDRQLVLEQVLAENGIAAPEKVEHYEPKGEFKTRLDSERREWIRRMVGALFPHGLPTPK